MRTVVIVETKTKKTVATYPVNIQGQNYQPADREFFNEAWRCASEDGLVDPDQRDDYSFAFV